MFVPQLAKIFGSDFVDAQMRKFNGNGTAILYELSRTHWKAIDQPGERCSEEAERPDTLECITRYVESKVCNRERNVPNDIILL